jgi:hypothetical protein
MKYHAFPEERRFSFLPVLYDMTLSDFLRGKLPKGFGFTALAIL